MTRNAALLGMLLGLAVPPPALGATVLGTVAAGDAVAAGPVWSGPDAIWAESSPAGDITVRSSASRLPVQSLPRVADGLSQRVVSIAASAGRVALVRRVVRPPPPEPPCVQVCPERPVPPPTPVSDEVWTGPVGGAFHRVLRRSLGAQCAGALVPTDVKVVGSAVLVAEAAPEPPCAVLRPRRISGRITSITPTGRRVLATFRQRTRPLHLAAAGAWIAWADSEDISGSITVFDRRELRVEYRVPMRRFATSSFDVDEHGRLALVGATINRYLCGPDRPADVYRLAVSSPRDPEPRLLRPRAGADAVAIAGGWLVSVGVDARCQTPTTLIARKLSTPDTAQPISRRAACPLSFADYQRPEFNGSALLGQSTRRPCASSQQPRIDITAVQILH